MVYIVLTSYYLTDSLIILSSHNYNPEEKCTWLLELEDESTRRSKCGSLEEVGWAEMVVRDFQAALRAEEKAPCCFEEVWVVWEEVEAEGVGGGGDEDLRRVSSALEPECTNIPLPATTKFLLWGKCEKKLWIPMNKKTYKNYEQFLYKIFIWGQSGIMI